MPRHFRDFLTHCLAATGAICLISCGMIKPELGPISKATSTKTPSLKLNTVNGSAITYRAKYGSDYEIQGNVIAKYPHFNLALFSEKTLPSQKGTIHIYELTSKDGIAKTHISCDTREPEKKHFYLENLHFYYHSNSKGAINIYMPPQLLAYR